MKRFLLFWIIALMLLALMPDVFASTLIYNESFEGTGLPNGWATWFGTTNFDATPGYQSTESVTYSEGSGNFIPSSVFSTSIMRNYSIMLNISNYAGHGGTAIFNIQENCRIGFGTTGYLEHFGAGSMGANTSFAIPLNIWIVMQVELNATVCGAYLINASNGSVISKLGPTSMANDQINARGVRGGTGMRMDNFTILEGSWDGFPVPPIPDTTPPNITYFNLTNGNGCESWNTDKNNACNTSSVTPTVQFNTSENAWCAIAGSSSSISLDLNYTNMGSSRNCTGAASGEGTREHFCTLTSQDELVYDTSYFFISCKDSSNNQNNTSTSGALSLSITGLEAAGRTSIGLGIQNALLSGYTNYTDLPVYARNLNNSLAVGIFDKAAEKNNKLWTFNRIGVSDSYVNMPNITDVLYTLEFANKTSSNITLEVEKLINATK